jgi:hypothetical protein
MAPRRLAVAGALLLLLAPAAVMAAQVRFGVNWRAHWRVRFHGRGHG